MASATVEDYIKRIHLLQQADGGELVSLGGLSTAMDVVPGTVTTMVKALAEAGLVNYEPRRGVRLTPGGEKLALHVLRRHRLIELFLVQVLKLDWSEVHEEAEAMEHAVSNKVIDRIDELLGFPGVDPHGDPIPTIAGLVTDIKTRPLWTCAAGDEVKIMRVDNQDPAFLRFVERQGLTPGTQIKVQALEPQAEALTLTVGSTPTPITLGTAAALRILVSI